MNTVDQHEGNISPGNIRTQWVNMRGITYITAHQGVVGSLYLLRLSEYNVRHTHFNAQRNWSTSEPNVQDVVGITD